ncbi:MAG TPA: hypothetical protein VFV95_09980 [Vicinamibacterales bacterium]|nr:hypothetical protein [Vicinamibacterales bacterium]
MRATRHFWLALLLPIVFSGCGGTEQPVTAATTPSPKAHANMLQFMRAFPFPHSNVIFDTQSRDPESQEKKASMSFSVYRWGDSDTYAGWAGVENSALALADMAPLLLIPRACSNGKAAPVDREDWKKAVQGLVTTSDEVLKAAKTRNQDVMLDASEKLSNACAACHDIYRDVDLSGGERCSVKP